MSHIQVECGSYRITLDEVDRVKAEHTLRQLRLAPSRTTEPTSAIRLTALDGDSNQQELVVVAYEDPSHLDEHSAICVKGFLIFVAGSYAICVTPQLDEILWTCQCGPGSCLGIYALPDEDAVVAHGEMAITKLSSVGAILWQTTGKDIFTGPLAIRDDAILATDFNGDVYAIQVATGETTLIPRGTEPVPE